MTHQSFSVILSSHIGKLHKSELIFIGHNRRTNVIGIGLYMILVYANYKIICIVVRMLLWLLSINGRWKETRGPRVPQLYARGIHREGGSDNYFYDTLVIFSNFIITYREPFTGPNYMLFASVITDGLM